MARVLITGGTGLIGGALAVRLAERGDALTFLTRSPEKAPASLTKLGRVEKWSAHEPGDWQKCIDGQDVVVHLAGERAIGKRLTASVRSALFQSRVDTSERLVEAIERATVRPRTFVCASAVGFYGHAHGDEPLDETALAGSDFLAELCVKWEAAANRAATLGVRVVNARFGIVLGRGALVVKLLGLPFRLFVGGPVGSGKQVISWVHQADVVEALLRCIDDERATGPFNIAAPNAVSNAELSKTFGAVLHRPSWLPAPAFAMKLALGEGAEPILGGQRAIPKKLEELGFTFAFPSYAARSKTAWRDYW